GPAHGLCAWSLAARRRVHACRLFGAPLAIPAFDRPMCRDRHRPDRQCSKLDSAGPLVRTAAANRDGRDLLRNRRRGPDPGAGLPNLDRACGLARRLSTVWRGRAASAGADVAPAMAAIFAWCSTRHDKGGRGGVYGRRLDVAVSDAPPCLLGAIFDLL